MVFDEDDSLEPCAELAPRPYGGVATSRAVAVLDGVTSKVNMRSNPRILAVIAVAGSLCCSRPPAAPPPSDASPLIGAALPDFNRTTLSGQRFEPLSTRGRVVVVKLFAKYCVPCRRTLPAAERLHERYPEVVFVGVAEDESESDAREVVAEHGLTFPVIHDRENVIAGRFRASTLPVTVVADQTGTIRWLRTGPVEEDELMSVIEKVEATKEVR